MQSFLDKLKKQKKLQMIEPSEEISQAYLEKSEKSLRSAKATYEIKSYEDSVALSYYSMYYSVLALFFKAGVKCENHAGTIILLEKIFGIDNELLQKAKTERIDKQYYVDFSVTKKEVNQMIKVAEQFNSIIFNFIDELNNKKIGDYLSKLKDILNE